MHHQAIKLVRSFCEKVINEDNENVIPILYSGFLLAAEFGIVEVAEIILEYYPDAVTFMKDNAYTGYHLVVINRHENIFNLIYQTTQTRHVVSNVFDDKKNIYHLAGKLAPQHRLNIVSGPALQMQRELQWFREVEKFVLPTSKQMKNREGKSPAVIFMESHSALVREGEKWMDTANSCTVATVVFAAAISVPGGSNKDLGIPILSKKKAFVVFAISDAFSLFSSSTVVLMFLSILTSHYAQADFLYSLPNMMIIALVALFFSVTTMIIAFSATVYLVFAKK